MKCSLCGGEARLVAGKHPGYREGTRYDIHECAACGSSFADPLAVDEAIYRDIYGSIESVPGYNRYYGYYRRVLDEKSPLDYLCAQEESYWAVGTHLRRKRARAGGFRILEIGCGMGYFTYALARDGFDVTGADISRDAIDKATRSFGKHYVCVGADAPPAAGEDIYDVLVMNQLIEHVPDVHGFLSGSLSRLSDSGEILVTTPNKSAGPQSAWDTELPPVHLWWFGEESMRRLAERHGLDVAFVDFTEYYAGCYRQRPAPGIAAPTPRSILDAQGRVLEPATPPAGRSALSGLLEKTGLLDPVRSVRDRLTGRSRWQGARGPILCAVFTRRTSR
jgi:SAM-dependent methyltransferase